MYMGILILQKLFLEALLDIFYFPVWWYAGGALHAMRYCAVLLKQGNSRLAPGIWLANLFVPMFGQFDWQGRIVSFFMRLVQIIVRTIALTVWLLCCVLLFVLWLAIPIVVWYGIFYGI
jgi:hypothetical protein